MKMQNYFLLSTLFFISCLFAAQHGVIQANLDGITVSLPHIVQTHSAITPIMHISYQTAKTAGKAVPYDNSTQCGIQKILERAAHQEICKTEPLIRQVCNQIDKSFLKLRGWNRVFESLRTIGKISERDVHNAVKELQTIEAYIPAECSSPAIYHRLARTHPYVADLIYQIIECRVKLFKNDKESSVDRLLNKELSQPLSNYIKNRADDMYAEEQKAGEQKVAVALCSMVLGFILVLVGGM